MARKWGKTTASQFSKIIENLIVLRSNIEQGRISKFYTWHLQYTWEGKACHICRLLWFNRGFDKSAWTVVRFPRTTCPKLFSMLSMYGRYTTRYRVDRTGCQSFQPELGATKRCQNLCVWPEDFCWVDRKHITKSCLCLLAKSVPRVLRSPDEVAEGGERGDRAYLKTPHPARRGLICTA